MSDARVGFELKTGTYWELLGERGDGPPLLFIHGGGGTGACWRATPDGRRAGLTCWRSVAMSAG